MGITDQPHAIIDPVGARVMAIEPTWEAASRKAQAMRQAGEEGAHRAYLTAAANIRHGLPRTPGT